MNAYRETLIGLAVLFLLTIPSLLMAQQQLSFPALGLSFTQPQGWVGQEGDGFYIFQHPQIPGFILLAPHESQTLTAMRQEAQQGIVEENGTQLMPASMIENYGQNGLCATYAGTLEWQPAQAYIIGLLSPHGGGVTIMAATTTEQFNGNYANFAKQVASTVVFSKPQGAQGNAAQGNAGASSGGTLQEWKTFLSGVRLTYMDSYSSSTPGGGGYTSERIIDLCPEGFFNYRDSDVNSFGSYGGAYGSNKGGGRWEVVQQGANIVLILNFHSGEQYTYQVEYREEKTFLNGYRYFRTTASSPAEYRPQCW